jgi:hypothetical protein
MVPITRAHIVGSRIFQLGYISIVSIALANFIAPEKNFCFLILLLTMFLFSNMVIEDATYQTVDIRKAALLALGMLIVSISSLQDFLIRAFLGFAFFRIVYLLSVCIHCRKMSSFESVNDGYIETDPVPVAFLPCFAGGILIFIFVMQVSGKYFSVLWQLNTAINELIALYMEYSSLQARILIFLPWLLLEGLSWYLAKQHNGNIREGIGMGDVIVLPIFAAFFGMSIFFAIFTVSSFILFFAYFIRNLHQIH